MIICLDVHYRETFAQVGAVLLADWADAEAHSTRVTQSPLAGKYEPGQFYKRELPALLDMLKTIREPLDYILVDSYVYLAKDKPGLGAYLYEALERKIPIIGAAKTPFRAAEEVEVALLRGESKKPLYISSAGVDVDWAAAQIARMHGDYRIPTLVKLADTLSKLEE